LRRHNMSYHMKYQSNAECCVHPTIAASYEGGAWRGTRQESAPKS
jgi:hypothetical protein